MTEVNWDLAPEGAVELRTDGYTCRFFNAEGEKYNCGGGWVLPSSPSDWQTVATRPEPNEPCKTVEDVVEAYPDGWPHDDFDYCYWQLALDCGHDYSLFVFRPEHDFKGVESYLVCTREQFEACVKAKDGEQWAYELWGDRAYIKISEPDCDGYIMVVTEGGGYNLVKMDDLKPIEKSKPIISDEQLSLILDAASAWGVEPDVCQDYLSGFKVEDTGDKCEF